MIFDCDGTLVDSEPITNGILADLFGERGVAMTPQDVSRAFRDGRTQDLAACLAAVLARHGLAMDDAFVPQYRQRIAAAFRTALQPMDGALDLVRALPLPKCVATSGTREKTELSLSLTGLLPFFLGRIYSSYDIGRWKPDPAIFLHAAQAMGCEATGCAVVEDSVPGALAGVAAGMTVFVLQPDAIDDDLPQGVTIVRSLHELRDLLQLAGA